MFMIKYHYFFLLSLCLIGGLWAVQKPVQSESMLIETAGFLFLKSYRNAIMEATLLTIIQIEIYI